MNLINFLSQVDRTVKHKSFEEIAYFLHDYARTLPEEEREAFLNRLSSLRSGGGAQKENPKADGYADKIYEEVTEIMQQLEQIEDGDLELVGNLNIEYDEWYNNDTNEFIFEDPQNIADILEKAGNLVHKCIDYELFQAGFELADSLLTLEIPVGGIYCEYGSETMSLKEFDEQKISDLGYRQLVLDAMYAAYQCHALEERPGALYRIISNSESACLTLELLMQQGKEELGEFPEFLKLWTEYLGASRGREAERLLREAVDLCDDTDYMLTIARKFPVEHPEVYVRLLELYDGNDGSESAEKGLAAGEEALAAIPSCYVIRSRAAVLTSAFALRRKEYEKAEHCWLEAFRSDTGLVNYLRLALESQDYSNYREEVRQIIQTQFQAKTNQPTSQSQYGNRKEYKPKENSPDGSTYYMLQFFEGEFQTVLEKGMSVTEPLGWSATFMKTGIALFLLYFYEYTDLSVGCLAMLRKITDAASFTCREYMQGLLVQRMQRSTELDSERFFWECFGTWKKRVSITKPEEEKILKKLDQWIRLRVEGIMQGNHRNYYGECAGFIAALGEVKESRGELNAKAELMESYRAAYSRRTAFHQELREFGMKDTRKNKV